jgi:uncharacterized protein (TIGR02466 family)
MKPKLSSVKDTLLAFPTPIHQAHYDNVGDLNTELTRQILALREKSPGVQKSNLGGWHSEATLLQDLGEPYGSRLGRMFVESIHALLGNLFEGIESLPTRVNVDAWAIVNEAGHSNQPHIHAGCAWSGVYYVAIEPGLGGEIYFQDPRTEAVMCPHPYNLLGTAALVNIAPSPGSLLVFPSFVYHGVHAYRGTKPRISIAFNLR